MTRTSTLHGRAARAGLPTGDGLTEKDWGERHRVLVRLAGLCLVGLLAWGLGQGWSVGHVLVDLVPIVPLLAVAAWGRPGRRARAATCTLALFAECAAGVHFADGRPEAHFAFFVGIVLIAIYEDWIVFAVGAAFVLAEHAVMGTTNAHATFGHDGAPVLWAAVHSAFIAAAGTASVFWWKSNATVRDQARRATRRARQQEAVATVGKRALAGLRVAQLEQLIVATVRDVLAVPSASLLALGEDGELSPRVLFGHGDEVGKIPGGARMSHSALAVELREPVVVEDRDVEDRFDVTTMTRLGLRAGMSVPVWDGHHIRGTLTAHAHWPRAFDEDDVHFLDSLGQILGGTLEREGMERRLLHASRYDHLTGLANRTTCMAHLERALDDARRDGGVVAVLYGDVDRSRRSTTPTATRSATSC